MHIRRVARSLTLTYDVDGDDDDDDDDDLGPLSILK